MARNVQLSLKDVTRSALERIIMQLATADEAEEKKILDSLADNASDPLKESEDLADLTEEKRGKPSPVSTEEEPVRKGKA
jgi:hypothetical protein